MTSLVFALQILLLIEKVSSFHSQYGQSKLHYRNIESLQILRKDEIVTQKQKQKTSSIPSSHIRKDMSMFLSSIPSEDDMLRNDDDDDDLEEELVNLGIDIGKELGLSPSQQKEIIKQGTELMEKAYEKEIADIEKQRLRMKRDTDREAGLRSMSSDLRAKYEAEKLLERIDKKSNDFLDKTKEVRESTKMAAAADRNMQGKGIELGSWGRDSSGNVVTTGYSYRAPSSDSSSDKSSFIQTKASSLNDYEDDEWGEVISVKMENKILIVNNDNKESQAVLKELCNKLEDDLNIKTEIISPIRPAPLGGLDSQTVVFFASSFPDKASVMTMIERLLSRTASGNGRVSVPPSHIICISSLGTEKASSNGLFGFMMTGVNGKLDKYREMEEGIISKCRTRFGNQSFDFSILKIGNIVPTNKVKLPLSITDGDIGSGDIDASTAANVITQTIAYQYHSRNTTLSAIGSSNIASIETSQEQYDDLFLSLDGPELLRTALPTLDNNAQLQEKCKFYAQNWAYTKFIDAKTTGLSTPVIVENTKDGVKIIFKPTNTGKSYKSKDEERKVEQQRSTSYSSPSSSSTSSNKKQQPVSVNINTKEMVEGGIEIIFENDYNGNYRLRAKRCNMSYDTVVKEMSEKTILSKLKNAVDYFINNN